MSALVLGLALAAPGVEGSPAWVAPAHLSSPEGPLGVVFEPRYPDAASLDARAEADLRALADVSASLDGAARDEALRALRTRLDAVEAWRARTSAALVPLPALPDDRTGLLLRLAAEQATLELQLALLEAGPPARAPRRARHPDRPHGSIERFGGPALVPAGTTVRDAVAFGHDVIVEGRVAHDAVAFGGDVVVREGGEVQGEAVAFGGRVLLAPGVLPPAGAHAFGPGFDEGGSGPDTAERARRALIGALALGGVGVLGLGLFPEPLDRVARVAGSRPVLSTFAGVFGAAALLIGAFLFAITLIGLPVSLLLLAALGASAALGLAAAALKMGETLPLPAGAGRHGAMLAGAALLALLFALPVVGLPVGLAVTLLGLGAALLARFGA